MISAVCSPTETYAGGEKRWILIGDSNAAGCGIEDICDAYYFPLLGFPSLDNSFPSETFAFATSRLRSPIKADLILIHVENDFLFGNKAVIDDLRGLFERVRSLYPHSRVFFLTSTPLVAPWEGDIDQLCEKHRIKWIRFEFPYEDPEMVCADRIHWTAHGHKWVAEVIESDVR